MNLEKILKEFKQHKVKFVIIGATAGVAHGYARLTKDLDLFVEPVRKNVEKSLEALCACGYDLQGVTVDEAMQKKLLFRQYILELDIHPHVTGISFKEVWDHRVEYRLAGQDVYFASLDDLIVMKKAAGREKDREDLRHLEEIRRQKRS
ncbi:MAG: nucleotidyltransferase [Deltaproteobacteria bacterium]|nr:nucleotidyltransferase [Deltaproteobacteria bacterium]